MNKEPFKKYRVEEGVKCVCNSCQAWFLLPENYAVCCPRCTGNNISTIWVKPVMFFVPEKVLFNLEDTVDLDEVK